MVTSASTCAGAFTLTAMSADRCFAVCCPVSSRNGCRTLFLARLIIVAVWALAIAAVFPVTIYAQLIPSSRGARSEITAVIRSSIDSIDWGAPL